MLLIQMHQILTDVQWTSNGSNKDSKIVKTLFALQNMMMLKI